MCFSALVAATNEQHQQCKQPVPCPFATMQSQSFIYQSENGPVKVPTNPQRVIVLTRFLTGNAMALGMPLVGVDDKSKTKMNFEIKLKNVEAVTDESLEKIIELKPDKQIAPTVTYT